MINTSERTFIEYYMRYGSYQYPLQQSLDGRWVWNGRFGPVGLPATYATRSQAKRAIARYVDENEILGMI